MKIIPKQLICNYYLKYLCMIFARINGMPLTLLYNKTGDLCLLFYNQRMKNLMSLANFTVGAKSPTQ